VHKLLALALAAAFAAPAEATRDLAAADRLAAANDAAATRASTIVEATSVACIQVSGAPASVADELAWLPVKFELRVANVLAVPSYQRFARVVANGLSADPTLRAFRADVPKLARQDVRLKRMRLDFCSFLDDWRRAGWPRGYFDMWYARKLKQAGVDAALVDRLACDWSVSRRASRASASHAIRPIGW
jgi:cytochrome c5